MGTELGTIRIKMKVKVGERLASEKPNLYMVVCTGHFTEIHRS